MKRSLLKLIQYPVKAEAKEGPKSIVKGPIEKGLIMPGTSSYNTPHSWWYSTASNNNSNPVKHRGENKSRYCLEM